MQDGGGGRTCGKSVDRSLCELRELAAKKESVGSGDGLGHGELDGREGGDDGGADR